ncbi:hypothetical protein Tco_0503548 [Tanacetum coccineum]
MSITKEQQQALDDALVPREQRLRIGNCNYRLSTTFKPKEPTFQVALDVLSLTPFYQAFLISASVPTIYMHELWVTILLLKRKYLLTIVELGYFEDIKSLFNVKVDTLHQPWRTFRTIINKCLSGKMDDPNITMEEYIRLQVEKTIERSIGKLPHTPEVIYSNDLDFFKDFENEFPAIVYNDALTSKSDFLTEPALSP